MSLWKSESGGGLNLEETARVLFARGLHLIANGGGIVTMSAQSYTAMHVLLRDYAERVLHEAIKG